MLPLKGQSVTRSGDNMLLLVKTLCVNSYGIERPACCLTWDYIYVAAHYLIIIHYPHYFVSLTAITLLVFACSYDT